MSMSSRADANRSRWRVSLTSMRAANVAKSTGIRFVGVRSFRIAAPGIAIFVRHAEIGASGIARIATNAPMASPYHASVAGGEAIAYFEAKGVKGQLRNGDGLITIDAMCFAKGKQLLRFSQITATIGDCRAQSP